LEERKTGCGWTSLDKIGNVDLQAVYPAAITRVYLWPEFRQGKSVFEGGGDASGGCIVYISIRWAIRCFRRGMKGDERSWSYRKHGLQIP
jgi:hypothetical protein